MTIVTYIMLIIATFLASCGIRVARLASTLMIRFVRNKDHMAKHSILSHTIRDLRIVLTWLPEVTDPLRSCPDLSPLRDSLKH